MTRTMGHTKLPVSTDQATLVSSSVDVSACLVELAEMFRARLTPNVSLEVETDARILRVGCRKEDLQIAVMLLLQNAREALPMGGRISLSATCSASPSVKAEVEISVRDNGIGMPRQTLIQATVPYFTTKSNGLGGFGLPLVEEFARSVGGRIQLESEPTVGTLARIHLPIAG
ncbi:hypothetical protein HT585_28855 [Ensifer sp. HO-A22]|uniref:histidine kinase n=1 Tax=Ensifer oleiphilus TaxID=2742698 RepID=A0A7Y6QC24_9HYPH|nr:ATP-binding protein [Ensifer oleiphilus]NVD42882.1 hypothetical protein [Ensifer oleiphilus]